MRIGAAGFTVVELMTVVAIVSILAMIAIPSFSHLSATTKVKTASTTLYLALIKARSEAVKRNAAVTIDPHDDGWDQGWQILASGGTVLSNQGELKGVSVVPGDDNPATVVYLRSGRIRDAAAPTFEISAESTASIKRCISADPAGRPLVREAAC